MVAAWYFKESDEDKRSLHQYEPNQEVSFAELEKIGVYYQRIDNTQPDFMDKIEAICVERQYKNRDTIDISPEKLPNYDEKLKTFFTEHLHEDEEIRYILAGSGYFDVRSNEDRWIRIAVNSSDLIILPAGIYHRFTLDDKNYLKALRLFKEDPKWTPLNRSDETDKNFFRTQYINQFIAV
ncbi:1,2-dihydroxy-3-keto-5-methylthiopentene dioxygenase [Phlyctochytrium bullatum]|nr:1,2-dihydroxy-3-keto-5-methylthiopentene dioxygenase [Phlyctochytrium bullatum]